MQCPDIESLERFAGDGLDAAARSELQRHVGECSSCARMLSDVSANLAAMAPVAAALRGSAAISDAVSGPVIPGYHVIREIGRGGAGVVFEARQIDPPRRIALKILRAGFGPRDHRRFQRETRAMARLQHSSIAVLHACGTTSEGIHYLAVEYVDGTPLTSYAAQHRLSREARLRLFLDVCAAAAHAHRRGVIHRDLKPGNILVADGEPPRVKILDFGLAQLGLLEDEAPESITEVGSLAGTLAYMSPEQTRGDPHALDIRSDVYSLGVMLYELLLDALPYTVNRSSVASAIRTICESPPRRPRDIAAGLALDLETIVLKALEKDPQRRYQSADALAADVQRFLRSEPIAARPPTLRYQLSKLIQRHRRVAVAAGAGIVVLIAATGIATGQAIRAGREEAAAKRDAATAREISQFLQDLIAQVEYGRHDVTLRDALDGAARRIDAGALADEPEVHVPVRNAIANAYRALALFDEAERHMRTAMDITRRSLPLDDAHRIELPNDLGLLMKDRGDFAAAEPLLREALDAARAMHAAGHPRVLLALTNYGALLVDLEQLDRAESVLREANAAIEAADARETTTGAACLKHLGRLAYCRRNYPEADRLLEEASARIDRLLTGDHPAKASVMIDRARVYRADQRRADAESMYHAAQAMRRRLHGEAHPLTREVTEELRALSGGE